MRKTLAPLLLLLLISLTLAGAAYASAATPERIGPVAPGLPLDPELLDSEDEGEIEEVEWDEDEEEAEDEWEEWEEGEESPTECLLRSAGAKAVLTGQGKLRLTVRYTAYEPTATTVDYRLSGSKGSLHLPQARAHLGKRGMLRLNETLSEAEAERASAAQGFTVKLRIPAAPRECRSLFTRHLTIKRQSAGRLTWSQSDSIFGGDSQ